MSREKKRLCYLAEKALAPNSHCDRAASADTSVWEVNSFDIPVEDHHNQAIEESARCQPYIRHRAFQVRDAWVHYVTWEKRKSAIPGRSQGRGGVG